LGFISSVYTGISSLPGSRDDGFVNVMTRDRLSEDAWAHRRRVHAHVHQSVHSQNTRLTVIRSVRVPERSLGKVMPTSTRQASGPWRDR
jgi:hypothetical protein